MLERLELWTPPSRLARRIRFAASAVLHFVGAVLLGVTLGCAMAFLTGTSLAEIMATPFFW